MTSEPAARPEVAAWKALVDALRGAGDKLEADTAGLDPTEQADGFRALLRGLTNQLSRFEVDRERPELVPFNGWRQKFLMDNPDFGYWVTEVRGDRGYRIHGSRGDASYVSITVYRRAGGLDSEAAARIDSDSMCFDDTGAFVVTIGGSDPGTGDRLTLPEGSAVIWVRFFYDDVTHDEPGSCRIEPVAEPDVPPMIDAARFCSQLGTLAATTAMLPTIFEMSTAEDRDPPNTLRHWSEMAGGAVFTEPGIHYLRGGWRLAPDEALVIEGGVVDGRYRFVVAAADPGREMDWIDTEGREFGIVVMRFLQPRTTPTLPSARVIPLDDLGGLR